MTNCFCAHSSVILVFVPRCFGTREINTKITISWALKQFVTRVHTLFSIYVMMSSWLMGPKLGAKIKVPAGVRKYMHVENWQQVHRQLKSFEKWFELLDNEVVWENRDSTDEIMHDSRTALLLTYFMSLTKLYQPSTDGVLFKLNWYRRSLKIVLKACVVCLLCYSRVFHITVTS